MSSLLVAQSILSISQHYTIYVSFFILFGGLIGNIFNIIVFSHLKILRNNSSAFYLISESIANFITLCIPFTFRIGINAFGYDPSQTSIVWCKLRQAFGQGCTLIGLTIICFSAIDQYLSTNYHPYLRQLSTLKLAKHLTAYATIIWILHTIPIIVFLEIRELYGCAAFNNGFMAYVTYVYYPILSGLLPIFISSLFSLLAYRNVRRIVRRQMPVVRRRLDRQMTSMILIRVIFLIICTLPYTIQRIYSLISPADKNDYIRAASEQLIGAITISFLYANSSISFYIFMISSRRFRGQFKYVLFKKCWQLYCKRKRRTRMNQVDPISQLASVELE